MFPFRGARRRLVTAAAGAAVIAVIAAVVSVTSGAAAPAKHYRMTLIVGVTNNPFYSSMSRGAKAEGAKLGVSVTVQGATTWSPSAQTPILDAAIASHPNAIILVATDPKAMDLPLKQAKQAGIVTVTADGDVQTPANRIAFFVSSNYVGGVLAGKTLASQIHGKGEVFVLMAIPGVPDGTQRLNGFKAGLGSALKNGQIKLLPLQYSGEDQVKGSAIMEAVLRGHPNLAGVFAEDTINAQAVAVTLKNAHLGGKVKAVGFDASPLEVQAVKQGIFAAAIGQKPFDEGADAVKAAYQTLNGSHAYHGQTIHTGFVIITPKNVNSPMVQKYAYH